MKNVFYFIIAVSVMFMFFQQCPCNKEAKDKQELEDFHVKMAGQRKATEIVNGWIDSNSVTTDTQESIYYIDTEFWNNKTYQEKEMVVKTLVLYDESKHVEAVQSIVLKDKMSGKKLASFTDLGGMDIETD